MLIFYSSIIIARSTVQTISKKYYVYPIVQSFQKYKHINILR